MILGDSNVNAATKGYIENPNFGLCGRENITCWDLMQLLNDAAKQKMEFNSKQCILFYAFNMALMNI